MKFFISIVLIALLSVAGCIYLPWWSIAIAAFAVTALIVQKPGYAFLSGFISLLLLWGVLAWYISFKNEDILAHRISLLMFKIDSPFLLIFVTALIGALVGGFAALTGSFLRKAVKA